MSPRTDKEEEEAVGLDLGKQSSENDSTVFADIVNASSERNDESSTLDSNFRYIGYTRSLARLFRYFAFSSDIGVAFSPVVSAKIVSAAYYTTLGYCFVDVGFEAYKLKKRGYVSEHDATKKITMVQCIIERASFQAVASVAVPSLIIHTTVDFTTKIVTKIGRFQKWGPTIAGLAAVPLLPLFLDHPIKHTMETGFRRYGPWKDEASKLHSD